MASNWIMEEVPSFDYTRCTSVCILCVKPLAETCLSSLDTQNRNTIIYKAMGICHRLWLLEKVVEEHREGIIAVACVWIAAVGRLSLDELVIKWTALGLDKANVISKTTLQCAISDSLKILLDIHIKEAFALAGCAISKLEKSAELESLTMSNLLDLYKTPSCIMYDTWKLVQAAIRIADGSSDRNWSDVFGAKLDDTEYENIKLRLHLSRHCNSKGKKSLPFPRTNTADIESIQLPTSNQLFPVDSITFKPTDSRTRWDCCNFIVAMAEELHGLIKQEEISLLVCGGFFISQRFLSVEDSGAFKAIAVVSLWLAAGGSLTLNEIIEAAAIVIEQEENISIEDSFATLIDDVSMDKLVGRVFDFNFKQLDNWLTEARPKIIERFPTINMKNLETSLNHLVDSIFSSACCIYFKSTTILVYLLFEATFDRDANLVPNLPAASGGAEFVHAFKMASEIALDVGGEKVKASEMFKLGEMIAKLSPKT